MRKITYSEAINEGQKEALRKDVNVFLLGQGVDNPWCVGTTTRGILAEFGARRVIDVPISENGMTGAAIGAAMAGMRPVVFHPRMDFMYLAMDQIINHCAQWYYMFGGQVNVPITIRGIVNRGNEQAAQHSQSPYSMYAHVPGIKIVMPSNAYDAKGLFISAIFDENPVLYIDDRWLYETTCDVPEGYYEVPIGKANVVTEGTDITIVAISYLVPEAISAGEELSKSGISAEVIDLRSIKPLDMDTIIKSVKKTGRLVIADPAWPICSVASEISSVISEKLFGQLKCAPIKINLPDVPAPASTPLEKVFYPNKTTIINKIKSVIQ